MSQSRSFKRQHPSPRVVRPGQMVPARRGSARRLVIGLGVLVGVMVASSAWAYREVTRAPDVTAIPQDPALIPDSVVEPISEYFPRNTAVYGRLGMDAGVVQLLRGAATGTGQGMGASFQALERFLPLGLNTAAGSPGGAAAPDAGSAALMATPAGRLVTTLLQQLDREIAFAVFPNLIADQPVGLTIVAGIKDPALVSSLIFEARRQLPEASALDRVHLEGNRIWFSTSSLGFSGLARDGDFKAAMACLPADRFGTAYINASSLESVARACGWYVDQGGRSRGAEGAAIAFFNDPEVRSFLLDLEREGGTHQHLGMAATNRLGLVQTFSHSDWQPRDPVAFRQRWQAIVSRTLSSSMRELQSLSRTTGS